MFSYVYFNLDYDYNEAIICYYATGASKNAPPKDYSLSSSKFNRAMDAFSSISILASVFGNGILPEIQVIIRSYSKANICISTPRPFYKT
jgi:hypothetical protein